MLLFSFQQKGKTASPRPSLLVPWPEVQKIWIDALPNLITLPKTSEFAPENRVVWWLEIHGWMDGWFRWKLQTPKLFGNFLSSEPTESMNFRWSFSTRWIRFRDFSSSLGLKTSLIERHGLKLNQVLEIPVPKKRPKIIKGNGEATINTIVGGWTNPSPKYARQIGGFSSGKGEQKQIFETTYIVNYSHVMNPNSRNAIHIWIYMLHLHISKGQNHQPTSWFSSCGTEEPGKTSGRNTSVGWNMLLER